MSSRDDLRTTLRTLLEEEIGETYTDLGDRQDLREGLGLDSVDIVGLIMRVEREFHVRPTIEDLTPVRTVGDLIDLLHAKLGDEPLILRPRRAGDEQAAA